MVGFHFPFRSKETKSRAQSIDSSFVNVKYNQPLPRSKLRKSVPSKDATIVVERSMAEATRNFNGRQSRSVDFPRVGMSDGYERDKQTGEVIDHTEMLHALVHTDSIEAPRYRMWYAKDDEPAHPGEDVVAKLPSKLWLQVLDHMEPADAASFAYSCKAFQKLLGMKPWTVINHPKNRQHKIDFLTRMDKHLPHHLFCFDCGMYHLRTQRGREALKPTNTFNPLYACPNLTNPNKIAPRIRITSGRSLPLTFVQLAIRAHQHSPEHGVTINTLSKRYKDKEPSTWSHQTRYVIVKGHLLMRVTSQCWAAPALPPAGERHLLYSREDFVPYFSVCPHWRDGVLMPMVKCAIHHIPEPPKGSGLDRVVQDTKYHFHPPNPIVSLCQDCRPMRRCPECPSEYLIQLQMAEDKGDPIHTFKQKLILTRWSDLGDGSSPYSPEWAAVAGISDNYDSFTALGKRAIAGVFEAEVYGDVIPGQNLMSLNPEKEKKGEAGHDWY